MRIETLSNVIASLFVLTALTACGTRPFAVDDTNAAEVLGRFVSTQPLYLYAECEPGIFVACRHTSSSTFRLRAYPTTTYRAGEDGGLTPIAHEADHVLEPGAIVVFERVEWRSSKTLARFLWVGGHTLHPQAGRLDVAYIIVPPSHAPISADVATARPAWIQRAQY